MEPDLSRPSETPEYDENFIRLLEMMWGEGFLSPGGAGEVAAILAGEVLAGTTVLDIGSGAGGAALKIGREYAVAQVTGIDVVPELVERSRRLCEAARLCDRVSFELVAAGPLPFADGAFDIVFTKDALLHVPGKIGMFREITRVLRPGGRFLGSDWLAGENIGRCPHWAKFLELRRPSFVMTDRQTMFQAMNNAGLVDVKSFDRSEWFAQTARADVESVEGRQRERFQQFLGPSAYEGWLAVRRAIAGAAASGALRPTHLKGRKPADAIHQ
jgi:phosphoethanolamine N-methyltransferase